MQVLSTCHFEPCSKSSGSLLAVLCFWTTLCLCLSGFASVISLQLSPRSWKRLASYCIGRQKKEVGLVQPLAAGIKFPGVSGSWTGSYTVSMTIRHPMPPHATPFHKTHRHMMTHGQSRRQKMCPCAHLG